MLCLCGFMLDDEHGEAIASVWSCCWQAQAACPTRMVILCSSQHHQQLADAGNSQESFLDEGFILDKRIGIGQPQRLENAKILVANTAMDTDKVKIYGARVRVDSMTKVRPAWGCSLASCCASCVCLRWRSGMHRLPSKTLRRQYATLVSHVPRAGAPSPG